MGNVDTLRSVFEAFNRRDFDAVLPHAHPDIELRPALQELDVRGLYRGRDELKEFFTTITDAWDLYEFEPLETIEVADDRLLVVERWRARGRQGIEFDFELTDVYTFHDGLVTRIDGFRDRARALEATRP